MATLDISSVTAPKLTGAYLYVGEDKGGRPWLTPCARLQAGFGRLALTWTPRAIGTHNGLIMEAENSLIQPPVCHSSAATCTGEWADKFKPADLKLSAASWAAQLCPNVDKNKPIMIVDERASKHVKVFLVDLSKATNVLSMLQVGRGASQAAKGPPRSLPRTSLIVRAE